MMTQFHYHYFVTLWSRTWVLQLRVMKAFELEHGCGSNILLKIMFTLWHPADFGDFRKKNA